MDENNLTSQEAPKQDLPATETSCCDSGCDCNKAAVSGKKMNIVIGSIILLVAAGVFAYKLNKAQTIQKSAETYATQPNQCTTAVVSSMPSSEQAQPGPVKIESISPGTVGDNLESLNALNTVARDKDAVFILITSGKETVKQETVSALHGVRQTLGNKGVIVGLYTMNSSAPEYKQLSSQVKPPAIIVACKGRGMNAVPADTTEAKLLQAFVAASQAGGCGSSCSPGACK